MVRTHSFLVIPNQNRRNMDNKDMMRRIVGYNDNKWYRIWTTHSEISSLKEKPGCCIRHVKLPIQSLKKEEEAAQEEEEANLDGDEDSNKRNSKKTIKLGPQF